MIETIQVEAEKIVERLSCEVEDLAETKARKSIEFEDILKTITDNTDINQLLGDSLEKLNSILSNLSTAQLGALTHILFGISIYYLTMNIATAYYGDKLIIYFKLEERYPRLAKWIKYRRIYQHYNIGYNIILILGITGYIVFVNISDSLTVGSTSTGTGTSQSLTSNLNQSFDDLYNILNDSIINNVLNFFKPVEVSGHLDSLLGVQLVLYFSIIIMAISVSLLLILYLLINIFILNKDRLLNHFNNKIVRFYIKYQTILAYISFYILPVLMIFGLLSIILASYHLITHPIPYESMDIDLHQYINSKK